MTQKLSSKNLKDSLEKLIMAQGSLERAVTLPIENERDMAGIIQSFEYVFELSWKTLKRLLAVLGHETGAARDTFKMAYKVGFLSEEQVWLDILEARNETSHTYSKELAKALVKRIKEKYAKVFHALVQSIQAKAKELS